jgi:hypothetical protein
MKTSFADGDAIAQAAAKEMKALLDRKMHARFYALANKAQCAR